MTAACNQGQVGELDQAAKPGGGGGGVTCRKGTTLCNGVCVNLQTSPTSCGTCGNACATGATCSAGACACPSGQLACNGACIDVQSDAANCGACGNACAAGNSCVAGACVLACQAPLRNCFGQCVDTQTDEANCNICGNVCASGATCVSGLCTLDCGTLTNCGGACADTQSDRYNCGACGTRCAINQTCTAGACVTTCAAPAVNCNNVCVDPATDEANCGACGNVCATGQTCTAGACACPTGQSLCNGACVDLKVDMANCGACGATCTPDLELCSAGVCSAVGGAGCLGCHSSVKDDPASPGSARRAVASDFSRNSHHVYSSATSGTYKLTDNDCVVCHAEATVPAQGGSPTLTALHRNGLIDLRNADDNAGYFQYDKRAVCVASGGTATQCDTASTATTPVPWVQTNAAKWASGLATWKSETSGRTDDLVGAPTVACSPSGAGCQKGLDRFCISCHDADGASAAFAVGDVGATPINPFNDASISNAYDLVNRGGVVDVASRVHVTARTASGGATTAADRDVGARSPDGRMDPPEGVFSRHAVRGLSGSTYGGTSSAWDTTTYFTTQAGGTARWASNSVMGCSDCHATDGANGVNGNAHGANSEYLLKDGQGGATEPASLSFSAYVCARCHAAASYSGSIHTGNGGDWTDSASVTGTNRVVASTSGGNVYGIACFNCHGGGAVSKTGATFPTGSFGEGGYGTIHGTSQVLGVGLNGGAGYRNAYRFMNGNSMRFYDPAGWTSTANRTCYTLNVSGDTWGGCIKHGSGVSQTPNPQSVRPLAY